MVFENQIISFSYSFVCLCTEGNCLDAMAAAVEKSDVILLCVTERYKNSMSCRSGRPLLFDMFNNH